MKVIFEVIEGYKCPGCNWDEHGTYRLEGDDIPLCPACFCEMLSTEGYEVRYPKR